jgi:AraC-like DNA-binding protein
MDIYYIAGITLSFFLGITLLGKKNNSLADRILALWLFVIGLHLFLFYSFISGKIFNYPWLLGVHFPLPLLHGPFLYLYALALTGKIKKLDVKRGLHFVPALLSYAYLTGFFLLSSEEKIEVFKNKGAGYEIFLSVNSIAVTISGIAYVVLTALLQRKHRRNIMDEFSNTEKINLDWILYLIYGIALIWVFVIFSMDEFIFGTAVLFVLFIGYFGMRQVGIFTPDHRTNKIHIQKQETVSIQTSPAENLEVTEIDQDEEIQNPSSVIEGNFENVHLRKKYSKSGLSSEAASELHDKLNLVMVSEKIFCDGELTLTKLAKKLGTHPNYLSQVINEKEGKNFFDYINTLRTEEFKKLIANGNNRKFTLLSLAFECGFNSKSSFNKYFKKVTGQSPSEYLQMINAEAAA